MSNFDALKRMPLRSFASMVFDVARGECQTEEEFIAFLEKEVPEELEDTLKEALQKNAVLQ